MWIHPQVTLGPLPLRRPDTFLIPTCSPNRPPSNAHPSLPPTIRTSLPHTCLPRTRIHSQAHPSKRHSSYSWSLESTPPYQTEQTSFPTLISLRFQGTGDGPLHFLPPLQTVLFPLKYFMPSPLASSPLSSLKMC